MACSMQPACSCHATVCTVCDCLHDPCGRLCTAERQILLATRLCLRRARHLLWRLRARRLP